jgi:hypothetical protein
MGEAVRLRDRAAKLFALAIKLRESRGASAAATIWSRWRTSRWRRPKRLSVTRAAANRSNACGFGAGSTTPYWKLMAASARLTFAGGHRVTGPGAAPGAAMLVPCPGRFRIRWPAAFDTLTAPSIRNTPSA